MKKNVFYRALIVAGVPLLFLFIAVGIIVARYGRFSADRGWRTDFRNGIFSVAEIDPSGNAAGKLQKNDIILAIDGKPPVKNLGLYGGEAIHIAKPHYTVRISRNHSELDLTLSQNINSNKSNLFRGLLVLISGFVSFLVGMLIGLSKPDERITQIAALMGLSIGLMQLLTTLDPMAIFFGTREYQLNYLVWFLSFSPLPVGFAFDFFHRFPADPHSRSRWRYLKYVFYLWSGSIAAYFSVLRGVLLWNVPSGIHDAMVRIQPMILDIDVILNPLMLTSLPLICAAIAWNYRRIADQQNRNRIRWISFGALAGITPVSLYFVLQTLRRTGIVASITYATLNVFFQIATIWLTLVPITMAYAVIKHRVFGIHVVVRLGFRYLLAKHVLQLFLYLPPVVLVATILANRERPVFDVLFSNTVYIGLALAALFGLKYRNTLLEILDRKFFRESYKSEKILMDLIEDVEEMDSLSQVSRAVSLQIESALHPKNIYVFYRGLHEDKLVLGHSSGERNNDLTIAMQSQFLKVAENESDAQSVSFFKRPEIPAEEQEWIESLRVNLVVPVIGTNKRLAGLLLLGEKRSEEAYTPPDKKMLKAVARQMGVVYENLRLKEKVAHGMKVQREVLDHLQTENRNLVRECPACGICYDSDAERCQRDGSELTLTLPVDRTIDGKYRLERLLGKGGMGAVYEATDLRLQRKVGVKILIGSMFGDSNALTRFEREARASAKMKHPNVVTVYDFGGIEGKGAYLVMELLSGSTLREILKEQGNIQPAIAAEWFAQILKGVRAAHQNGIIHRDLKPENIFLCKSEEGLPVLKILDLGLAKTKQGEDHPESASLTKPGTILGTVYYMSPEQISGSEVDERSDIFSLGVILAEALTGTHPFLGNTIGDIAAQIMKKEFELSGESHQVKRLNSALQKCIAKNRNQRYASIAEMQEEVLPLLTDCPPFLPPGSTIDQAETI